MDSDEAYREKARQALQMNATNYIEQILVATSDYPNKTEKTCGALLEK